MTEVQHRQRKFTKNNKIRETSHINRNYSIQSKRIQLNSKIPEKEKKTQKTQNNCLDKKESSAQGSCNPQDTKTGEGKKEDEPKWNLYDRLSYESTNCEKFLREVILGRRIGFYRLKEEIGTGSFSNVRLGIHLLTHSKEIILC